VHKDDGLELTDVRVCAAVRCAPPANAPTPEERDTCSPWLARELSLLPRLRVVVVLGGFGWTALWPVLGAAGYALPRPRPAFGHGVEVTLAGPRGPLTLLGSYHVSQQNTFTGKLTEPMLDAVLARARELAAAGG
jgi:uracil-DNA glycosylase